MFKRMTLLALAIWSTSPNVLGGSTFSRVKTWSSGETLTASDLNAEFNNILNNLTPAGVDDYSATTTEMRAVTDPYPASAESQATSLQGELERIRYQILEIKKSMQASNITYWYQDLPTAGVFTISGSSVGVNDTSPDYGLDLEGGTLGTSGNITSDGNITTTGDDVDIATHTAISGNTTISGTLTVTGLINNSPTSRIIATLSSDITGNSSNSTVLINSWTDVQDSLGEIGTTTFTVTTTGFYDVCFTPLIVRSAAGSIQGLTAAVYVNGSENRAIRLEPIDGDDGTKGSFGSTASLPICGLFRFTASDSVTFKASAVIDSGGNFDIKNDDGGNTTRGTILTISGR